MYKVYLKKWKWLLVFAGYNLIALFFVTQKALNYIITDEPVPWNSVFVSEMVYWYVWLALTPLIFWFCRRIKLDRQQWKKAILYHFLVGLLIAPVQNSVWYYLDLWWIRANPNSLIIASLPNLIDNFIYGALTSFYKYWVLIGAYYGIIYYLQYREQEQKSKELELQTARLNTQLMQSRLDVLKMQLHPHFLFNALNTISVYMKENIEKARLMLIRLSELLRITLESKDVQEVPLRKEIDILNYYLEVEQARFEDKLEVKWKIDSGSLNGMVPYLILQPILENAIHHGISTNRGGGRVTVSAKRKDSQLIIKVSDNGTGTDTKNGYGIGLSNTRERLQQLYGKEHSFELTSREGHGTIVMIRIPFRTETENGSPDNGYGVE